MRNSFTQILCVFFVCGFIAAGFSQNVAINTGGNSPYTGTVLDLSNTNIAGTAGFMPPKVTLTNASLLSPVTGTASQLTGLIVYNTSTSTSNGLWGAGLYYWTGSAWVCMSCCGPVSVGTGTLSYTPNGYTVTYKTVGTTNFTPSCSGTVQVLVVAGGGGGGGNGGGGGGGGGVVYNASYAVAANTAVTVTVGAGGTASQNTPVQVGTNGGNSVFGTITAIGGGLAGDRDFNSSGAAGGSGGGGGGYDIGTGSGGAGTGGQGNNGGQGYESVLLSGCPSAGAGGGGAGSAGGAGSYGQGGNGGNGVTYFGNTYGGGGGGASACYNTEYYSNGDNCQGPLQAYTAGGLGGTGGGGNGQAYYPAVSGGANTGGGGGGGGGVCSGGGADGNGGSGIVIVVYTY